MKQIQFYTPSGAAVTAVTEEQMRAVDRIAVQEFGLGLLQMMENAGRSLAANALGMLDNPPGAEITILAGSSGNGGGGICCARHLHNRGYSVSLVLSREAGALEGAARAQMDILLAAGFRPTPLSQAGGAIRRSALVVDALIGYGLQGAPRGVAGELIDLCNRQARRVLSLDIPSGMDSTTGETPGNFVNPERTLTLALPKTGLQNPEAGDLYLADIGIPPEVYRRLGLSFDPLFGSSYWLPLSRTR